MWISYMQRSAPALIAACGSPQWIVTPDPVLAIWLYIPVRLASPTFKGLQHTNQSRLRGYVFSSEDGLPDGFPWCSKWIWILKRILAIERVGCSLWHVDSLSNTRLNIRIITAWRWICYCAVSAEEPLQAWGESRAQAPLRVVYAQCHEQSSIVIECLVHIVLQRRNK